MTRYQCAFCRIIKVFDVSVIEQNKYYNKTEVAKIFCLSINTINRYVPWEFVEKKKHIRKCIVGSELIRCINQYKEKELSLERIKKYREKISNSDYVSKALNDLSRSMSKEMV